MCGRFILGVELPDLQEAFPVWSWPEAWTPRYNIAPTQPVAVVANNGEGRVEFFRWGLIPSWAKDPKIGNRMINARADTLAEKPSFRNAFRRRRCLIPADGFYEWRREKGGGKTPMVVRLKGGQPFAFAGLWEVWRPKEAPEAEPLLTCTIITTEPNELAATIHNRMPVIMPRQAYDLWLNPAERDPGELQELLGPYPAEEMEAYPVSTLVNNPVNDVPECIQPLA